MSLVDTKHDYRECDDEHCPLFPCRVYKEGRTDGHVEGRAIGYAEGYPDGYSEGNADGFLAGYAAGSAG